MERGVLWSLKNSIGLCFGCVCWTSFEYGQRILEIHRIWGQWPPTPGDGMIEAFRLLCVCPPGPDAISEPDKETDWVLPGPGGAQCGGGQVLWHSGELLSARARERPHQSSSWIEMSRFSVLNDIITNSEYPQTERWKRSKFLRLKWPVDVYRCEGAPMLIILMTFESKSHRFERKHKDKKVKSSPSNNNCRSGNLDFLWSNLRLDDCKQ